MGVIELLPATGAPDQAEAVLAQPGDSRTCWCQWFRGTRSEFDAAGTLGRREAFRAQLGVAGVGPGILAVRDGEPVGWCAVAPRSEYPALDRSPLFGRQPVADGTWAVTCFVVPREHRRQGVAAALLDGAIDHARDHGASVLEAYPVDVDAKASTTAAELYHGPLGLFVSRGFAIVARPSRTRALVRRSL